MPAGEMRVGRVISERYRLDRVLGEGGMGTVFEAADLVGGRAVAAKLLNLQSAASKAAVEALRREASAAASIGSPHIARVLDFGDDGGTPFLVMELLAGEDLGRRIARVGRLSLRQTAALLEQLAQALEAAHAAGIVHLDLKPANVFLANEGGREDVVKVLDFGIARVVQEPSLALQTGSLLGTPNYMSPELAMGRHADVDRRADVFAVGAILYECMSGRMAFDAKSLAGALVQVAQARPPPLRGLPPDVAEPLERVLGRALAKSRDERYPTVAALRDDFCAVRDAVGADAIVDPSAISRTDLRPPTLSGGGDAAGRRRGIIVAAAIGALVALATGAWLLLAR